MTDTPHLEALAMRTAAAEACTDIIKKYDVMKPDGVTYEPMRVQRAAKGMVSIAREDILALPLEADHAALLAEAVKLPEIAALMDFVNADRELRMIGILNATEDQMKILINARQKAHDTLSALETP